MPKITRDEILTVFRRMVGRFGLDRVTMKELAEESGVSVGTLYRHFENKEALVAAVEEGWLRHLRDRNAKIQVGDAAPEARLYDLVVVHAARLSEVVRTDQAVFEMLVGSLHLRYIDRDVTDVRRRILDDMASTAGVVLAQGTAAGDFDVPDPDEAGRHLVEAFAEYFSPTALVRRPHTEVVTGLEGMFAFLMRGIRVRERAGRSPQNNGGTS